MKKLLLFALLCFSAAYFHAASTDLNVSGAAGSTSAGQFQTVQTQGLTVSTLTFSTGVRIYPTLAGSIAGGANADIFFGVNNRLSLYQTSALTGPASIFIVATTKDWTVADSVGGTGSNQWYSNLDGDYAWGMHINSPATAKGQIGYASGAHGADSYGYIGVADSTNSYVMRGWHQTSRHVGDLIRLDAETAFATSAYPAQVPTYSGVFEGNFMRLQKRGVNMMVVNSSGAVTSYDPTGAETIVMWNNGNAGIIQTTVTGFAILSATGGTDFYSASLAQTMNATVNANGNATFDVSGSTITIGGGATTDRVILGGLPKIPEDAAPRTNLTPGQSSLLVVNTGATPDQVCISTGPLISQWALLSNFATPCSN